MTLSPYIRFFGDFVNASEELTLLHEYISHMDESLEKARIACQKAGTPAPKTELIIAEDKAELLASPFPLILHEGFIISSIIFLEQELGRFTVAIRSTEGLGLSLRDLSGSLIERFRKYVELVGNMPLLISTSLWEDIRGALEIRNCLVHNSGRLEGFNRAPLIDSFAGRHNTPHIEDRWMRVNRDTSIKLLEVIESFVRAMYESSFVRYPKRKK